MNTKYLVYILLGMLIGTTSCELPDNTDPKSATEVPPGSLLAQALRDGLALIDDMNQNVNVSRFLCQYSSQVQYTDPSRYQFSDRQIPDGYWNASYLALRDLHEVKALLSEKPPAGPAGYSLKWENKKAIVDIMEVLLYHNLVDFFGNVPYTEALSGYGETSPAYDDARYIYDDLQSRLTADIAVLQAGGSAGSWGPEDLVYGGDVGLWRKFAATLKMRLALRLADVDPVKAGSELAMAIEAGPLESEEVMQLPWLGIAPHVNTIYHVFVVANRRDYAPSKTIVDIMWDLDDARLPAYFTSVDSAYRPPWGPDREYIGLEYGMVGGLGYLQYSHFSDRMFEPDFPATFSCHAEVEFLLAEAAARGLITPQTAREHYEAGIAESHAFWGVDLDPAYLEHPDVAWDPARAKELIGIQKWIAQYNRGNEGWSTWRCFDWPVLMPPVEMTYDAIPMRMPYPYNEPDLNGDNYAEASEAMGGDEMSTLLFWDAVRSSPTPAPGF